MNIEVRIGLFAACVRIILVNGSAKSPSIARCQLEMYHLNHR